MHAARKDPLIPMLFTCLKGYGPSLFARDATAGLIVAVIALPLSIALALASGVGPEEGLYTAIAAGFVISALGGSAVQIAGPTAAFATIVAGIVAKSGTEGLFAATLLAGALLVLMGLLRLGSLIHYIPHTITTGFTAGIAVTIAIGQLKDFLGLTYPAGTVTVETAQKLAAAVANIGPLNFWALALGVLGVLIQIFWPKTGSRVPGSLLVVLLSGAAVALCKLPINTIGDLYTIRAGLPSLRLPSLALAQITAALPDALTIAVLAGIESLLSCVVADHMTGGQHRSNMELIAQGAGNAASALFGGIPATGAIARTAANIKNGGLTPVAGIVHALVLLAVLVLLMPWAALIPMPAIAAILFMVAWNMSQYREVGRLLHNAPWQEKLVLLVTFGLTVAFDLVIAIAVGMVLHYAFIALHSLRNKK